MSVRKVQPVAQGESADVTRVVPMTDPLGQLALRSAPNPVHAREILGILSSSEEHQKSSIT